MNDVEAYLESHQQTLALDICEAQVYTSWIPIDVAISDDMFDLCGDTSEQAI